MEPTGTITRRATGWVVNLRLADGTRRQLSAKSKSDAQARLQEALQGPTATATPKTRHAAFTLSQALELTIQTRWQGTAGARTAIINAEKWLKRFGPTCPIEDIRAVDVKDFRLEQLKAGSRPSTVNKVTSALRAMASVALTYGHITDKPQYPPQLPLTNTKDRVFSDKEIEAFVAWFLATGHAEYADLFIFLTETGARIGETLALRGEDIDLQKGRCTFWRTKNGKPRTIPLTARAIDALAEHTPPRPTYRVWTISYGQMRTQFDNAKLALGLPDVTIHTARHTVCSRMGGGGIPLAKLMKYSGHTTLQAVNRYLHLNADDLDDCVAVLSAASTLQ
jgi:integrase